MSHWLKALLLGFIIGLQACGAPQFISERYKPKLHQVRPGETLYAIAWRHGMHYQQLARLNGIRPPYTIYPGQRLRLAADRHAVLKRNTPQAKSSAVSKSARAKSPVVQAKFNWHWPIEALGKAVKEVNGKHQGIELRAQLGTLIRAAAAGKVVYSGGGLPSYGQLVIIKHDEVFLSAYGYNRKLLVREGQQVTVGQVIAELGYSPQQYAALYFEIRRHGKAVDPMLYLPNRDDKP